MQVRRVSCFLFPPHSFTLLLSLPFLSPHQTYSHPKNHCRNQHTHHLNHLNNHHPLLQTHPLPLPGAWSSQEDLQEQGTYKSQARKEHLYQFSYPKVCIKGALRLCHCKSKNACQTLDKVVDTAKALFMEQE